MKILPPTKLSEMEQLLVDFKADLPTHIEFQTISAKVQRAKYNACIEEGFNEAEALELCKV
jgi:hypothetical protein